MNLHIIDSFLTKRSFKISPVNFSSRVLSCAFFSAHQVAYAEPYPIGNPICNFFRKTCMPSPNLVITIWETNPINGEPIERKVRVKRDICHNYDADNQLLGWGYEITGGNWY